MKIYEINSYGVRFIFKTEEEAIAHILDCLERSRERLSDYTLTSIKRKIVKDKREGQKITYYFYYFSGKFSGLRSASYRIFEI